MTKKGPTSKGGREKPPLKKPASSLNAPVKPDRPLGQRARYCETCQKIKQDGPRHKFDNKTHILRKLTQEEREQFPARCSSGEYRLTFGKYQKKSLSWVKEHHPSYLAWIMREKVYDQRADLKEALLQAELFPRSLLDESDSKVREAQAQDIVDSWSEAPAESRVRAVENEAPGPDLAEVEESTSPGPQRRKPLTEKARAKEVAHLKYMAPHQREEMYSNKPMRSALVEREHSTLDLMRMSPLQFTETMIAYGLLTLT